MSEELSFPSCDVSSPPTRPTVQIDSGLKPYVHKKQFMAPWKWMIYNVTVVSGVGCVDGCGCVKDFVWLPVLDMHTYISLVPRCVHGLGTRLYIHVNQHITDGQRTVYVHVDFTI